MTIKNADTSSSATILNITGGSKSNSDIWANIPQAIIVADVTGWRQTAPKQHIEALTHYILNKEEFKLSPSVRDLLKIITHNIPQEKLSECFLHIYSLISEKQEDGEYQVKAIQALTLSSFFRNKHAIMLLSKELLRILNIFTDIYKNHAEFKEVYEQISGIVEYWCRAAVTEVLGLSYNDSEPYDILDNEILSSFIQTKNSRIIRSYTKDFSLVFKPSSEDNIVETNGDHLGTLLGNNEPEEEISIDIESHPVFIEELPKKPRALAKRYIDQLASVNVLNIESSCDLIVKRDDLIARTPWMEEGIHLIYDDLLFKHHLNYGHIQIQPILLYGKPGVGKTHYAIEHFKTLGLGYSSLSAGGASSTADLIGTSAGYGTAQPCHPVTAMIRTGLANPGMLIDEVDKEAPVSPNGSIQDALLTIIEHKSASKYYDQCMLMHLDISRINWFFTANDMDRINMPLKDRCLALEVIAPGVEHFEVLLKNCIREIANTYNVETIKLPDIPQVSVDLILKKFVETGSIRLMKRLTYGAILAVFQNKEFDSNIYSVQTHKFKIGF